MSTAPPPTRPGSPKQRRARRRALLSWIPVTIVALICVAIAVGAVAMQNSWWVQPDRPASSDQRAEDGTSRFDSAGVDYLTRDGFARIKLTDDALAATDLGMPESGEREIDPIVPVTVLILGDGRTFGFQVVSQFVVASSDGEIDSVTVVPDASGTWPNVLADLRERADWGWTEADLAALEAQLGETGRTTTDSSYGADLPTLTTAGVAIDARVDVDRDNGYTALTYTLSR